jgi:hypothetical protein
MVTVREIGTVVALDFRWRGIVTVGTLVLLELTIGLIIFALASQGGFTGEIVFWLLVAVILPIPHLAVSIARLRWARAALSDLHRDYPGDAAYLFAGAAVAAGITEMTDWQSSHRVGQGAFVLRGDVLEIRAERTPEPLIYPYEEIVAVEEVRVWGSWLFLPQLRLRFSDDVQFMAALSQPGLRGACGFSTRRLRALGEEIENRASSNARGS